MVILLKGWILPIAYVKLHREGSAMNGATPSILISMQKYFFCKFKNLCPVFMVQSVAAHLDEDTKPM